jgi:hypothetical protein
VAVRPRGEGVELSCAPASEANGDLMRPPKRAEGESKAAPADAKWEGRDMGWKGEYADAVLPRSAEGPGGRYRKGDRMERGDGGDGR